MYAELSHELLRENTHKIFTQYSFNFNGNNVPLGADGNQSVVQAQN
jgi:hypothetical protein